MSSVPVIKLNDGKIMPALGIGTWKSKPGEVVQAVKDAIDVGYRHIDCAHIYGNEKEVGEAINYKIKEGIVKRGDLFVTSKLWNTLHRPDLVEEACRSSLKNLGLDYLDLYLIHWPMGYKEGVDLIPKVDGKVQYSDVDYVDTWHAVEALQELGLTKSIGISNFNKEQVERILEAGKVKPVTNQIECHPYLTQQKLGALLAKHDIAVTAYSPLGSPDNPLGKADDLKPLQDDKLKKIAIKYKKSVAQVLIRYQMDRGHAVIPKSVNKQRIGENFDVLDFKLSDEDVKYIDGFECNGRLVSLASDAGHKHYPFNSEY